MVKIDGELATNTFLTCASSLGPASCCIKFLNHNVLISTSLGKVESRHQSEAAWIDFYFYDVIT